MAQAPADPYVIAVISSGSALIGVLLASLVQAMTSRGVRKSQRDALEVQAGYAAQQALRAERRTAYTEFLTAANLAVHRARARGLRPTERAAPIANELSQLAWDLEAKHDAIGLISSESVVTASGALLTYVKDCLRAASMGKDVPDPTDNTWERAVAAMKAELDESMQAATLPPW